MTEVRTLEIRLYPNKAQEKSLLETLRLSCILYNHLLEHCRNAHDLGLKHPTEYELNKVIVNYKKDHPEYLKVYSQVLANVSTRVSLSFKMFFHRLEAKAEHAGYPRFKSSSRYDSFTYPQFGFSIVDGKLDLSKIGKLRIAGFRKVFGMLKTCTVKREGFGPHYRWKAFLTYEYEDKSTVFFEDSRDVIGVDLGLKTIMESSNDFRFVNPYHYLEAEKRIADIQKKMALFDKDSEVWFKYSQRLYHLFTRLKNIRKAERYEAVNSLLQKNCIISMEDIDYKKIQEKALGKGMKKSYRDASWAILTETLCIKAAEAGCTIVKVRPEYTSQRCSMCGRLVPKKLWERRHVCTCGVDIDRDKNASFNIERLGLQALQLTHCRMEILGHSGRSQWGFYQSPEPLARYKQGTNNQSN